MHKSNHLDAIDVPLELRLLAACCDHPISPASTALVEDLAARIEDWLSFSRIAGRHQVQGFVQDRLSACNAAPEPVRARWANEARIRATFNLRQAKATGELHHLLKANSIPNLVVKGLPLAANVYSSLTIKRSSDIDLLIETSDAWKAVDLLAREGFVASETGKPLDRRQTDAVVRHFKEITLRNDSGIVIDLHWRLIENHDLLKGIDPFANARQVSIENIGDIAILGEADEFAYLCAHGALSDWSRFKWLADVNAAIGARSDNEILNLYDHAKRLGAGPCVLQALALRALFWARPMPDPLRRELEMLDAPEFLAFPLARMTEPYLPRSSRHALRRIARQSRVRAILYQSRSNAVKELGAHLRALPDILAYPLPAGLDWLYAPLRPILWLARKRRA